MKKQNGMTHIALVFWIIVIIVVAVMAVRLFTNENNKRLLTNMTTDMLLLQGKVKVISQENAMAKEERPLIGEKVADNLEDEKVKKLIDNGVLNTEAEDFDKYYIINGPTLSSLNIYDGLNGEYYIVNYQSYEIIYTKGIETEEKTLYTLTEILEYSSNNATKTDEINGINDINAEVLDNVEPEE